jgi:NAD(P)-dependent dehydrogenase (short-subunit alcohol dehydrogenase family)
MEMLKLDMDIEADLGIDSIKRVEILSSIEEEIPSLSALPPEIIGQMKTLGQIVEYLLSTAESAVSAPKNKSLSNKNTDGYNEEPNALIDASQSPEAQPANAPSAACFPYVERKIVSLTTPARNRGNALPLPRNRKVFITDDGTGLARAIAGRLNQLDVETAVLNGHRLDAEDVQTAAGLVLIAADEQHTADFLKQAFVLTNQIAAGLLASGAEGGALLATITRLDGAFGFKGGGVTNPMQGGLAGLAKTAAHEWRQVSCHALDISPDWKDNAAVADAVVEELLFSGDSGVNEIGLEADARWIPTLEPASYPRGNLDIQPKEVIVISGGARGVTAAVAATLAQETKPTLVLMGRSPAPTPEPEWLAPLKDESIIKKAILEHDFNKQASPRELQKAYRTYLANREIRNNLDSMARTGADVHYHTVDIRDADQVKKVLAKVRSACGPIKGIIHGAGILEDRWIVDKTIEQFASVFDTKVKGLEALLAATRADPLKYLVLFSSVAARFGNGGQVDYAMANEVLNKMAQQESTIRPDCKVISVNWGPWDGGMVCTALKRKFHHDGISLISKDAGARCLLLEMSGGKNQPVEVVIGANVVPEPPKSGVCNMFQGPAQPTAEQETPVPVARQRLAVI